MLNATDERLNNRGVTIYAVERWAVKSSKGAASLASLQLPTLGHAARCKVAEERHYWPFRGGIV